MGEGDRAAQLVYFLGVLVLVVSAFAVRRVPLRRSLKMVLAWVLIFVAGFILFALRDDFRALGGRLMAAVSGAPEAVQGGALRIPAASDGHYWVNATINGRDARFLIDSGATISTITSETAGAAGIVPTGSFGAMVDTANGTVIEQRGEARSLRVGTIERRDLAIHIADSATVNVIGMNFLSTLSSWGVDGGALVLRP